MTRDEIMKLEAGIELDSLIAEKVMGWELHPHKTHWITTDTFWKMRQTGDFEPSTDIASAWEVVEKISEESGFVIDNCGSQWAAGIMNIKQNEYAGADTAPLAICRAALLAVMECQ